MYYCACVHGFPCHNRAIRHRLAKAHAFQQRQKKQLVEQQQFGKRRTRKMANLPPPPHPKPPALPHHTHTQTHTHTHAHTHTHTHARARAPARTHTHTHTHTKHNLPSTPRQLHFTVPTPRPPPLPPPRQSTSRPPPAPPPLPPPLSAVCHWLACFKTPGKYDQCA